MQVRIEQIQKKFLLVLVAVACVYFALPAPAPEVSGRHGSQTETSPRAQSGHQPHTSTADVTSHIALSRLPEQGQQTYRLIFLGGPFPYEKDGSVFGNRERLLPSRKRGYYREYTVRTPRVRHRGARRIVCGGWVAYRPKACYYTADHYDSFQFIDASGSPAGAHIVN